MEYAVLILATLFSAIVGALFVSFTTRDRARRGQIELGLRIDEIEGNQARIGARLTKIQKEHAGDASVEARQKAKSLKEEAMDRLSEPDPSAGGKSRPSVIPFRKA